MGALGKPLTLAISGLLLAFPTSAFAQNWTLTSAPIPNWSSIAMSADGSKLVAANGYKGPEAVLHFSTNGGTAWAMAEAPSGRWATVATSADGTKWIAAARYALFGVYLSTSSPAN